MWNLILQLEVVSPTLLKYGCSIGANATVTCGVTIGRFAMVGAGAVVTKNVAEDTLVVGMPARAIKKLERKSRKK